MAGTELVDLRPQPLERYAPLLADYPRVAREAERARDIFAGTAIWHVNSTRIGGGVAELLNALLPYARGVGVDARWAAIAGDAEFFAITKRIHNLLHGEEGDGGPLGEAEREHYEGLLAERAAELGGLVGRSDVVYLHDPQTAGLVPAMREAGAKVVWRCHIGVDHPNAFARRAWELLIPYVREADAYVFSREGFVWDGLDRSRAWMMPPAIDPFSPKNQDLDEATVGSIVAHIGLADGGPEGDPAFTRTDGARDTVQRQAEIVQEQPLPADAPIVAQVSRWDRLKDPLGVLECFARHVEDPEAHLVMAAPSPRAVSDDPEGAATYEDVLAALKALPAERRRRVHLASLPMEDVEENGAMVNALQRRATVILQKSLAEGFGLTVTEAMWKAKPVVATRVGGIQDQVVDGESGVLVEDARDLAGFGAALDGLLADPARAEREGDAARRRVGERFLAVRRLIEYVDLIGGLIQGSR